MVSLFWGDKTDHKALSYPSSGKSTDYNLSLHINLYHIAGILP